MVRGRMAPPPINMVPMVLTNLIDTPLSSRCCLHHLQHHVTLCLSVRQQCVYVRHLLWCLVSIGRQPPRRHSSLPSLLCAVRFPGLHPLSTLGKRRYPHIPKHLPLQDGFQPPGCSSVIQGGERHLCLLLDRQPVQLLNHQRMSQLQLNSAFFLSGIKRLKR